MLKQSKGEHNVVDALCPERVPFIFIQMPQKRSTSNQRTKHDGNILKNRHHKHYSINHEWPLGCRGNKKKTVCKNSTFPFILWVSP